MSYALVGQSYFERKEELENTQKELEMNLISQVGAARKLFPDLESDMDAVAYLLGVEEQDKALQLAKVETDIVGSRLDATQSQGAREIVESVSSGALLPATGVLMLVNFFGILPSVAEEIIGSARPRGVNGAG